MTGAIDEQIAVAFQELDGIEKAIIVGGLSAVNDRRITFAQFETWAGNLLDRYRAKDELTMSDMELPLAC